MATSVIGNELAVQLALELEGAVHNRTYRAVDAKDNIVVLGRLSSSSNPGPLNPFYTDIGGHVDKEGRATLSSPIMSRDHAKLVFSGGMIYLSDARSHHGTFLTRGGSRFQVLHPQVLQTGDIITFGKTVRKGGKTYTPLTAKVKILGDAQPFPMSPPFPSFTGHGYSLPPNFDEDDYPEDDVDVVKDDEIEAPWTHKQYKVVSPPYSPRSSSPQSPAFDIHSPVYSPLVAPPAPSPMFPMFPTQGLGFGGSVEPLTSFQSAYASPPPILPPINHSAQYAYFNFGGLPAIDTFSSPPKMSRPRFAPPNPSLGVPPQGRGHSIIDVDAESVIDVDAFPSPKRKTVNDAPAAEEGSDLEISEDEADKRKGLDKGKEREQDVDEDSASDEESDEQDDLFDEERFDHITDVSKELGDIKENADLSRRRIALNKIQTDQRILVLTGKLAKLQQKVDVTSQADEDSREQFNRTREEAIAAIQARQEVILKQIDTKKDVVLEKVESRQREYMSDLDVHRDDLEYDIDQVMKSVEDVGKDVNVAKDSVTEALADLTKVIDEAKASVKEHVNTIRVAAEAAIEEIQQTVASTKRKADEMDSLTIAPAPVVSVHEHRPIVKKRKHGPGASFAALATGATLWIALGVLGYDGNPSPLFG